MAYLKNENTFSNTLEKQMDDYKNDYQCDHVQLINQLFDEIVASPELIIHPPINETITILVGNKISTDVQLKKLFTKFVNDYDVTFPKKEDKQNPVILKQYNEFMNIFAFKYCDPFEPLIPSNIVLMKHLFIKIKEEKVVDNIKSMLVDYIYNCSENHTTIDTPPSDIVISNLKVSDYLKKVITRLFNSDNWVEFRNTLIDLFTYHHENKLQIWDIRNIWLKDKCMTYYLQYGKSISNSEIISIDENIKSWTINTIGNLAYAYIHSENKEIRLCAKKCIDFWRNVDN